MSKGYDKNMNKGYAANTKIKINPRLASAEFNGDQIAVKVLRATTSLPCRMAAFVGDDQEPTLVTEIDPKQVPTFVQFASLAQAAAKTAGLKKGHLVASQVYITPPWWKVAHHHQGMRFHYITAKDLIPV